jgi:hypothetical protein
MVNLLCHARLIAPLLMQNNDCLSQSLEPRIGPALRKPRVHTIVDEIGNDNRIDLWQPNRSIVGTFRRPEIIDYQFDAVDA